MTSASTSDWPERQRLMPSSSPGLRERKRPCATCLPITCTSSKRGRALSTAADLQGRGGSRAAVAWRVPCASLLFAAAVSTPDVQFTDIARQTGVDFKHENSATSNKYLVETMGGGVALIDYDNDGRLDIFFTNGARIDDPMSAGQQPDKSARKFWNRLYHQNADGSFSDVTETAGLTGAPQNYYGMGVAVGDYDNDGFDDLYVTNYAGNVLYHNNRDGTFSDVTARAGVAGGGDRKSVG